MSKLSLQIGAKDFDIKLDSDFHDFFMYDFSKVFKDKKNIEIKELLEAYMQKSYDNYQDSLKIEQLMNKMGQIK